MKQAILLIILLVSCIQALEDHILLDLWKKYKSTHGKVYLSSEHEQLRYEIFKENVELIEKHNSEHSLGMYNYTLGLSQFTDWTFEEFKEKMLGTRVSNKTRLASTATFIKLPKEVKLPDSMDWREKGVVTPVKNQGQCGSCWSFSATGALEGQHARATGNLVSLSEQQLVDCSGKYGNEGCNGGLMDNAFKYIQENGGLDSEDEYPYDGEDEDCKYDAKKVAATCNGFVDIPQEDEEAFEQALATVGPLSVAIAVTSKFMHYKDGVFVDHTCAQVNLNHGVLAVGYGVDEKTKAKYWLVKNSWGQNWGEEGYIRMARPKGCGILEAASYPLV